MCPASCAPRRPNFSKMRHFDLIWFDLICCPPSHIPPPVKVPWEAITSVSDAIHLWNIDGNSIEGPLKIYHIRIQCHSDDISTYPIQRTSDEHLCKIYETSMEHLLNAHCKSITSISDAILTTFWHIRSNEHPTNIYVTSIEHLWNICGTSIEGPLQIYHIRIRCHADDILTYVSDPTNIRRTHLWNIYWRSLTTFWHIRSNEHPTNIYVTSIEHLWNICGTSIEGPLQIYHIRIRCHADDILTYVSDPTNIRRTHLWNIYWRSLTTFWHIRPNEHPTNIYVTSIGNLWNIYGTSIEGTSM